MADNNLDPGFEEVQLDEGFVEEQTSAPRPEEFAPNYPTGEALAIGAAEHLVPAKPFSKASALVEKGLEAGSQALGLRDPDVAGQVLNKPLEEVSQETKGFIGEAERRAPEAVTLGQLGTGLTTGPVANRGAAALSKVAKISPAAMLEGTGNALEAFANKMSTATLDLPNSVKRRLPIAKLQKLGQLLRDAKITNQPSTLKTVGTKIDDLSSAANAELDDFYKLLDRHADDFGNPFTKEAVIADAESLLTEGQFADPKLAASIKNRLQELSSKFPDGYKFKPSELRAFSQELEDLGRTFTGTGAGPEQSTGKALSSVARRFRDHVGEMADELGMNKEGIQMGDAYRELSERSSHLADASKAIRARLKAGYSKPVKSTEIGGIVRATLRPLFTQPIRGATIKGIGAAADLSRWAGVAGNKFGGALTKIASTNPGGLAASHYVLSSQNPDYKEAFDKWLEKQDKESEEQSGY